MVVITHRINEANLAVLLHSPGGGIAKDMLRRGERVRSQAARNLAGGSGKPRRIDTGALRASLRNTPVIVGGAPGAQVSAGVWYATLVHDGTGIYGPRHRMITPKHGRYLVFTPKGGKGVVFARAVRGMVPNPFLADALSAAKR